MARTIFYIKLVHSLLFFIIAICVLYLLYSTLLGTIGILTWIAFAIAAGEGVILVLYDWQCPLTLWAEEKGAIRGSVADLFLPEWLSDRLFPIFGILFGISCVLLLYRLAF
ncbi:MAG: hypothetical protein R3224_09695 [Balneolaceae bacterium]|nr:hypothetical protein [Balneolaceae bacterium]